MKRKVEGTGNPSGKDDLEVDVSGGDWYQKIDAMKVRCENSEGREGRDAKAMSKLQKMGDAGIRENLDEPLKPSSQHAGISGLTGQHGSED
jgi:hypothetical protein